ncbi:MAG: hypothetical protein AAF456_14600 [Planctomycetota bacterium]
MRHMLWAVFALAISFPVAARFADDRFPEYNYSVADSSSGYRYVHEEAYGQIQFIRLVCEQNSSRDHATQLTILQSSLPDYVEDPWGNEFQFRVIETGGIWNSNYHLHCYSPGADGVSESEGDDPDDLNSWDSSKVKYYERQVHRDWTWYALTISICAFPLVLASGLVVAFFAGRIFRYFRTTSRHPKT